jgi:signal transduction histidine kinase
VKNLLLIIPLSISWLISCNNKQPKNLKINNSLYETAIDFRNNNKYDSAFLYFNEAKDFYLLQNDSLGTAKSFSNMAYILCNQKDYLGAQDLALAAISYFDHNNKEQFKNLESNYNTLGLATSSLADYKGAISFYQKAAYYSTNNNTKNIIKNNIAIAYRNLANYNKSIAIFSEILKENNDSLAYAKVLSNLAFTKWLQNTKYKATPTLLEALNIRVAKQDNEGLNASFAHLSDYYANKNLDSSAYYAAKMYQIANINRSPFDQIQALQKLIKSGPANQAKTYFLRYQNLVDSVQIANNKSKNQFALIRYEVEKNKAENLTLQKENAEKKYQIAKREVIIFGTLLIGVAGAMIGFIWYRKRKQKIELQAQQAIQESRLKTSKKVHDVVANGLYRIMAEVENQKEVEKDTLLDKIEELYEKSRDISYDDLHIDEANFNEKIAELIKSFATDNVKVLIVGNDVELWKSVNVNTKYELKQVLQELMVNMKRHSQANNTLVKFEIQHQKLNIAYKDNGIGLPKTLKFNNGLRNTGNRINGIGGTIIFDNEVDKGTLIKITVPLG